MTEFDPQLPHNQLPLLGDKAVFHDTCLLQLCHRIQVTLDRINRQFTQLPSQSAAKMVFSVGEATANTCPPNCSSDLNLLVRNISLNLIPSERSLYHSLRFYDALMLGCSSLKERRVCTATALMVARCISNDDLTIRELSGARLVRGTRKVVMYSPPAGKPLLLSRLANWELFLHERQNIHPLIRMAAGLCQFIAISPFREANMRSAHIVSQLLMMNLGLLEAPILNMSSYLLKYRRSYEDFFLATVFRNQWADWIEFVLKAVLHQASILEEKLQVYVQLWHEISEQVVGIAQRSDKDDLVCVLMQKPYCASKHLVDAGLVQRHTAALYLRKMRDIGLLDEQRHGRDKLYLNPRLLHFIQYGELQTAKQPDAKYRPTAG